MTERKRDRRRQREREREEGRERERGGKRQRGRERSITTVILHTGVGWLIRSRLVHMANIEGNIENGPGSSLITSHD